MPLIFDSFRTRDEARRFAAHVLAEYGLEARVYFNAPEAAEAAVFPDVLSMPVVLVERPHENDNYNRRADDPDESLEERLEASVAAFSGQFVGT